jgi:tetratricopeptide (TPR) repeat protein
MARWTRWLLGGPAALAVAAGAVWLARDHLAVDWDARAARAAPASGRDGAAREPLLRWLRARPSSAEAHALMARVALADGDLAEVTRRLNEARSQGHPAAELERIHAITLARMGRYAEAEPILVRLWNSDAQSEAAVDEALARIFLKTYRLSEARKVIGRWMQDAPDDGRPYLWLTEIDRRIEVDNPDSWERHYREALARDPGLDAARLGLAEALAHVHRNGEADEQCRLYLDRHPDDPAALAGAGRNAMELGDLSGAATLLDRALALAPENPLALKGRADLDCSAAT